jgi:uncharacterized protein YebE (UPF0316 family)
MTPNDVAGSVVIALLAATTVSLWTARVALAASGRRLATAVVAAIEALTFVLVFQQIAANLDALERVVGYAIGVGAGTLIGLHANERLSSGQSSVHVIVAGQRPDLRPLLHDLGWPTSAHDGCGPRGPITTMMIVVDDGRVAALLDDLRAVAPAAFITVHQLRRVHPVPLPGGLHQVRSRRTARRAGTHLRRADARP